MYEYKGVKIFWLGHDSFRIEGTKRVYIDPYQLKGGPTADVILVTHEHFDHLSLEDIRKIASPQTVIVASPPCKDQLSTLNVAKIVTVKPNETVEVQGVKVRAVPAYNLTKFREPGVPFHPKNQNHVGFILTLDGVSVYHAGDTDAVDEMKDVEVDIALLPVSGTYVMTAQEAAEAAKRLKAKVIIPMHYGAIVGSEKDAEEFKKLAPGEVQILKKET